MILFHQALPLTDPARGNRCFVRTPWTQRSLWVLVLLVVFYTINNIFWLKRHLLAIPPPWDQAFYLYMGLRYLHALSDAGPLAMFKEFVHLSSYAAPLFPLTTLPMYLLFGTSRLAAHLTNSFYLFLLLLGVYLLGKHVYGRKAGILATFFISTFTAIVNFSRDYLLEFPSAAFVTLGVYALLRSEDFRHRSWCLGFGVLVGLTLLTKTMAGVFFVGPVLYILGRVVMRRPLHSPFLLNFLLSVGVAVLVASVWWGPNFRTAIWYLIYFGFKEGSVPYRAAGSGIFTLKNLSYYFLALANHGASFFYTLLFVLLLLSRGVKRILWGERNISSKAEVVGNEGYLWTWLLVGYGILTVVPLKGEERFAQALLPPLALLLSGSIEGIQHRWLRGGVMVAAIGIGAFNYIGLTYEPRLIPRTHYLHPFAVISFEYPHYSWIRSKLHLSQGTHWPILDVLSLLADLSARVKTGEVKVLVVPDHPVFNASTLRYYAEVYRSPLIFSHISDGPINRDRLQEYDFVLVKSGGYQGPDFTTRYGDQIFAKLRMPDSGFIALPQVFSFPDDSHIIIFAAPHFLKTGPL